MFQMVPLAETRFGLHPLYDVDGWATPEQARPRPDFTYGTGDDPAEPHRQEAAAFLVFQSIRAAKTKDTPVVWWGASWGRIAATVLEATDHERFESALRRWQFWQWLTLGGAPFFPHPGGIGYEIPPHAGGLQTPLMHSHWGGVRLQYVADGLHELVGRGLVTRSDTRSHSPVFFPTKKLVNVLVRARIRLATVPEAVRTLSD